MSARALTEADVEAIAEAVARKLRTEAPAPRRRRERTRRVASAEAHERIAAKNRRYSGGGR